MIAVVVYHVAPERLPGGFLGVDIFFVISGFAVFGFLRRKASERDPVTTQKFLRRRASRLAPAFLGTVVLGTALLIVFVPPELQRESAITALFAMALLANVATDVLHVGYFSPEADSNIFLHLWSLAVEEQFYIVIGALLAFGWFSNKVLKSDRLLLVWTALFSALSLSLAILGSSDTVLPFGQSFIGFYSPLTRVWEFGAGILAVVISDRIRPVRPALANLSMGLALSVIGAIFLIWRVGYEHPGLMTLPIILATVAVLTLGKNSLVSRMLIQNRPMILAGNISYSLYLWHWVIVVAIRESFGWDFQLMIVALLLSALAGYGSWVLFENRHGSPAQRMAKN